jgi:hypothetical protein
MGKATNPKPRMAYAIDTENKNFLDQWAEQEGRSTANLVERLLLDAIARKKQTSTPIAESIGRNTSDRKT